jgi:hypothetical protein
MTMYSVNTRFYIAPIYTPTIDDICRYSTMARRQVYMNHDIHKMLDECLYKS